MAIDLGALSGSASNAKPNNATASKTANDGDDNFSRTLAASRSARDKSADAPNSDKTTPQTKAKAKADARAESGNKAAAQEHVAKTGAQPEGKPRETASNPAATKTTAADDATDTHADLTRRRLSSVSQLVARTQTATNTATNNAPPVAALVDGQAEVSARTAAGIPADTKTAATDSRKTAPSTKNTPTAADDKTGDADNKNDTPGPIAALIQAPLIAMQTIKPGNGSQDTAGDATSGRASSASDSLRVSWQQLFARLDGNAGNAASNGQNYSQAGGDSPAQLLAALTASGASGGRGADNPDGTTRFGILQAADNAAGGSSGNANAATMAGIGGHGLHSTASAQSASTGPGAAATSTSLSAPLASDNWNHALGQQTLRLAGSGQQQAQIQLHPRELGQINISVTVNDHNQAQVHFAAAHAQVRDAVEAALPQLRQSLAAGGLSLGQTSVGDQNSQAAFAGRDDQPDQRGGQPAGNVAAVGDIGETAADSATATSISRGSGQIGGIDIFA